MNKIVAGSVGAVLLAGGLLATTSTAAFADATPGSVATSTSASTPDEVKANKSAEVCASVLGSSATVPSGTVTLTVTRNGKVAGSATLAYNGTTVCMKTSKLRKAGKYTATASFTPAAGSEYQASSGSESFKVKKSHH